MHGSRHVCAYVPASVRSLLQSPVLPVEGLCTVIFIFCYDLFIAFFTLGFFKRKSQSLCRRDLSSEASHARWMLNVSKLKSHVRNSKTSEKCPCVKGEVTIKQGFEGEGLWCLNPAPEHT